MADLLTVKGYAVVTAASGQEALDKINSEQPDLVLLDVVMPEMSGYETCRKIREIPETRTLPVVMVTALDPSEERVKGIEAGADDFLTKPINQAETLARAESLLRIKELYDTVQAQATELSDWNKTSTARRGASESAGTTWTTETVLFASARRPDRGRRSRGSSKTQTRSDSDIPGSPRFTAFAEDRRAGRSHGRIREYDAAMGQADLGARRDPGTILPATA